MCHGFCGKAFPSSPCLKPPIRTHGPLRPWIEDNWRKAWPSCGGRFSEIWVRACLSCAVSRHARSVECRCRAGATASATAALTASCSSCMATCMALKHRWALRPAVAARLSSTGHFWRHSKCRLSHPAVSCNYCSAPAGFWGQAAANFLLLGAAKLERGKVLHAA